MATKSNNATSSSHNNDSKNSDVGKERKSSSNDGKTVKIDKAKDERPSKPMTWSDYYTITLLLIVNLANYADRFTVPSVLVEIDNEFKVRDQMILGLLQTVFVITYMTFSPIFGYLGDRFNRRILLAIGLFVWASVSLGSAFVTADIPNGFWVFMALRGVIGIGEASYVTITPTIFSDLFVGNRRTIVITIYQSTMLLGGGAGFMMASVVSSATGDWHNVFMVWPPIVYACIFGLIFLKEPERGKAEGATNIEISSYWEDLKYLTKIKSYVFCTLGYTSTVFVVGVFAFWAPTFAEFVMKLDDPDKDVSMVGFLFGLITILGGVTGAAGGTMASKWLRNSLKITDNAEAIVCAFGALLAGPVIYVNIVVSSYNLIVMWILLFFSLTFLSINLVLTQDMTLSVIIPTRRATGSGVQLLVSHLLGDAISPYLVGLFVDGFRYSADPPRDPNRLENFMYLQNALFFTTLICVIGAFCFVFCALYLSEDKKEALVLAASMSSKSLAIRADQSAVESFKMTAAPLMCPGAKSPLISESLRNHADNGKFVTGSYSSCCENNSNSSHSPAEHDNTETTISPLKETEFDQNQIVSF